MRRVIKLTLFWLSLVTATYHLNCFTFCYKHSQVAKNASYFHFQTPWTTFALEYISPNMQQSPPIRVLPKEWKAGNLAHGKGENALKDEQKPRCKRNKKWCGHKVNSDFREPYLSTAAEERRSLNTPPKLSERQPKATPRNYPNIKRLCLSSTSLDDLWLRPL